MSYLDQKYDVAILGIFKNEESFLPEWLDHYFDRNIDHIYLLNDQSNDKSVEIINAHSNIKNITLKHTDQSDLSKEEGRQHKLYNKYFSYCLSETHWLGIFDLDEFCYSPQEKNFKKILLEYNNTNIHELMIDWYWFGSNGYLDQPKDIVKSFNKRSEKLSKYLGQDLGISSMGYGFDWCCKSFAKTQGISYIKHHYNNYIYNDKQYLYGGSKNKRPFSYNLSDNGIMYINHYIGSKNYFMNNKVKRGSCNNNKTIQENKKLLYDYINQNQVEDTRLWHQTNE